MRLRIATTIGQRFIITVDELNEFDSIVRSGQPFETETGNVFFNQDHIVTVEILPEVVDNPS